MESDSYSIFRTYSNQEKEVITRLLRKVKMKEYLKKRWEEKYPGCQPAFNPFMSDSDLDVLSEWIQDYIDFRDSQIDCIINLSELDDTEKVNRIKEAMK